MWPANVCGSGISLIALTMLIRLIRQDANATVTSVTTVPKKKADQNADQLNVGAKAEFGCNVLADRACRGFHQNVSQNDTH